MSRFNEAMVIGLVMNVLAVQSCISAEDPKLPPQSLQSGATGGVASGQGGATSSVGGGADTGGAVAGTGGSDGVGAGWASGGTRATGGSSPSTGGLNSVGGGVSSSTSASSSGGCDFSSPACTAPCDAFAGTIATSWKQAPCQALLTCLQHDGSCITAADPLCGPKQAPSYAAPICGNDYYNAASDSDISTALTTYIKCVCGF